jgi:hypothetical protein
MDVTSKLEDLTAEPAPTAESDAMFGDGVAGPPLTEECETHILDEFRASSISAPTFTAERPSHLGGPRQRVVPAMPAMVVSVGPRKIDPSAPDPRDPFAHLDLRMNPAPSEQDRQRDSRRANEPTDQRESPYLRSALFVIMFALLVMLIWMLGARVFE